MELYRGQSKLERAFSMMLYITLLISAWFFVDTHALFSFSFYIQKYHTWIANIGINGGASPNIV